MLRRHTGPTSTDTHLPYTTLFRSTWISTSYAGAEAITVPLTGWLFRQVGEGRLFMICVVAFVLFSVCCGLSWSLESLVFFRVLQGLAGGPLIQIGRATV